MTLRSRSLRRLFRLHLFKWHRTKRKCEPRMTRSEAYRLTALTALTSRSVPKIMIIHWTIPFVWIDSLIQFYFFSYPKLINHGCINPMYRCSIPCCVKTVKFWMGIKMCLIVFTRDPTEDGQAMKCIKNMRTDIILHKTGASAFCQLLFQRATKPGISPTKCDNLQEYARIEESST